MVAAAATTCVPATANTATTILPAISGVSKKRIAPYVCSSCGSSNYIE